MKLKLSLVAIVSFIFFIGLSSAGKQKKGSSKVGQRCTDQACKTAAADLKRCMDTTVNPCENFYKFTCGKFLKEAKIPDDKEEITTFTEAIVKLDKKLRAIFEKKNCSDCPHYETYLKDYYKSCLNTSVIERGGEAIMLDLFNELGGWSLIDDSWDESKADLTAIMTTMLKYRLMNLFNFYVYNDETNSSVYTIIMQQGTLTFPIDYYTDDKYSDKMDAWKTLITRQIKALSKGKAKSAETEKNIKEIIALEKNLSTIMYSPEKFRLLRQEKIALCRLANKFKGVVNMTSIVEKLFGDVGIKIDGNESIAVYGIDYFDKLAKLLKETSKSTLINYLVWEMFNNLQIAMPRKYENYTMEFDMVVSDISKVEPRWKRCSLVASKLYKPLGAIYAKLHFKATAKEKVKNLIQELKKSFEGMIRNVTWLMKETQSHAINKLNKMMELIGYPDYYETDKDLFKELFDKIKDDEPKSKSFLRKHLDFLAIVANENYKLLRKAVDPDKPDMQVAVVNAFYSFSTNTIILPAGILQWPFFSDDLPMYLNYGGIGSFIGHEITHGFDDEGHQYDEKGTLHDWWNEEDKTNYDNASKCIAEMYSNFAVEELNETINGILTLGENIADNGGVRAAFKAYKIWKEENGEESKLHSLDFTPEQLFFINYGRSFCQKIRLKSLSTQIREDYHAPGYFRIIGSLMNMEEFSEVFECKPNSPMNPEKKCKVW